MRPSGSTAAAARPVEGSARELDWMDEERAEVSVRGEIARLFRRSLTRPRRLFGITLLAALAATAAVTKVLARPASARVSFRVAENAFDQSTAPPTKGALKEHVKSVVFTNKRLLELARENQLVPPEKLEDSPDRVIEEMRRALRVEVWRNEFIDSSDEGRTAHIAIAFHHPEAEKALAAARHLGRFIAREGEARRERLAKDAAGQAQAALAITRETLSRRERELSFRQLELHRAPRAAQALLQIEIADRSAQLGRLRSRTQDLDSVRSSLALRESLEHESLGVRFELIDPGQIERTTLTPEMLWKLVGLISLLVIFPFVALALGAFDSRILDLEDVRRLGLEPLGHVPAFRGDNAGSLSERLRVGEDPRV